jgi:hypothetical protein
MIEAGGSASAAHTLWRNPSCSIDYFAAAVPNRVLVFTFNWIGNRRTDGLGFGGSFLLERGFDVIAVKTTTDDWFHSLPEDAFASIDAFLAGGGRRYEHLSGYGSSMGGYGAIRFARRLGLSHVLALSPQFDIGILEDPRWHGYLGEIGVFSRLTPEMVAPGCTYTIVYDDTLNDRFHAENYSAIIGSDALRLMPVRYAGHPAGFLLEDIGELQPLARRVLAGERYQPSLPARKRSSHYLFGLARHCATGGKNAWALAISERHLAQAPRHPEGLMFRARLLQQCGDLNGALACAQAAIEIDDRVEHYKVVAANLLEALDRSDEAIAMLEAGLARAPTAIVLVRRLHRLRDIRS